MRFNLPISSRFLMQCQVTLDLGLGVGPIGIMWVWMRVGVEAGSGNVTFLWCNLGYFVIVLIGSGVTGESIVTFDSNYLVTLLSD